MPGVFVVHLDWLMNSVWHCRRERETLFLLAGVRFFFFFAVLSLPCAPVHRALADSTAGLREPFVLVKVELCAKCARRPHSTEASMGRSDVLAGCISVVV